MPKKDDTQTYGLDLDNKKFLKKGKQSQKSLKDLGDDKKNGLKSLNTDLAGIVKQAAFIGAAYLVLKTVMKSVFRGDEVKSLTRQFEILTDQAGVAGDALKEGMEEASSGLLSTADILQIVNERVSAFGDGVKKFPALMKIAEKSAQVTGKSLKETFDALATGIQDGSAEALKQQGIILETDKVLRSYAQSVGVAVEELTQQHKIQAVLNATIKEGNRAFGNIDTNITKMTNSVEQMKVALGNLSDAFSVVMESKFGKYIADLADSIKDYAEILKQRQERQTAKDVGDLNAQYLKQEDHVNRIVDQIERLEKTANQYQRGELSNARERLQAAQAGLEFLFRQKKAEDALNVSKKKGIINEKLAFDVAKREVTETRLQQSLLAIQKQALSDRVRLIETESQITAAAEEAKRILIAETSAKKKILINEEKMKVVRAGDNAAQIDQIEKNLANQLILIERQRLDQIKANNQERINITIARGESEEALNKLFNDRQIILEAERTFRLITNAENELITLQEKKEAEYLIEIEYEGLISDLYEEMFEARKKMYEEDSKRRRTLLAEFAAGFHSTTKKAGEDILNFAKIGARAADTLGSHMSNAFIAVGAGADSMGQAMKKAAIGALADIAAAEGKTLLIAGLNPFKAYLLPIGASLLALSGALRASVGGGGSAGGGAAGGGGGFAPAPSFAVEETSIEDEELKRKFVTIQIMGDYFETEETKNRLVELIREAADATDFKIQSVGGGL